MKKNQEEWIKDEIQTKVLSAYFSKETEDRVLAHIHHQIHERRSIMKLSKKKMSIVLAAAMIVIGSATAIGAGRIAYTSSHTNKNEAIHSASQLIGEAEKKFGKAPKIPEQFSDGSSYKEGYVTEIDAWDNAGNRIGGYPEALVSYTGNKDISLSVCKPLDNSENSSGMPQTTETYEDILIKGNVDNYLFLPPDQQPSEGDQQLEKEGKLMISYGSSQEERKAFKSVTWMEGGLYYHLYTFQDVELKEIIDLAKEVIDSGK